MMTETSRAGLGVVTEDVRAVPAGKKRTVESSYGKVSEPHPPYAPDPQMFPPSVCVCSASSAPATVFYSTINTPAGITIRGPTPPMSNRTRVCVVSISVILGPLLNRTSQSPSRVALFMCPFRGVTSPALTPLLMFSISLLFYCSLYLYCICF